MPAGVYPSYLIVERLMATVSAAPITTPLSSWVAPFDCEVVGVTMLAGTAPGGTAGVALNIQNTPTSQRVNTANAWNQAAVAAYNLWTTANVPSIIGTNTVYPAPPAAYPFVVTPQAYAQNYPFPGPAGTSGYQTAQSTALVVSNPVVTPPNSYRYGLGSMVQPDNTYTDYNGVVGTPASIIHAGDVLVFNVAAAGSGLGASANLAVDLILAKR